MDRYLADYLRLSDDDANAGESNSISSQRQIIEDYIASVHEFSGIPVKEFMDDGYSGTNFNRPGVQRLLEAVRKGEVSCIIVKDFSRFGRQYLEVSKFIEQIFPYLGVRFIAVNDHYDSDNHKGTTAELDVPVRNMINAMYSRDISKKVKSAKHTQMKQGVFSNAFAPFGYKKDDKDIHRLLIDEPAAKIVRRIFELAEGGHSAFQIADKLNADGEITPAQYKMQNGSKLAVNDTAKALWTSGIVSRILRDERYTGMFIGGQHETVQMGSGKKRHKPQEQWIRIPGALPVIIAPETFNSLVANRQKFVHNNKPNTGRILYKRVWCGYCGHVMQYVVDSLKPYYLCDTARYTKQHGCGRDRFREEQIIGIVKTAIQSQIEVMLDMERLCRNGKKELKQGALSAKATAARLDNEIGHSQSFKRQLYERYKGGSLDKAAYFSERETIEASISAKTTERDALLSQNVEQKGAIKSAHQFFGAFLKYQEIPALPAEMINKLVEAVYIYEMDRIEVRFSFRDELEQAIRASEGRL